MTTRRTAHDHRTRITPRVIALFTLLLLPGAGSAAQERDGAIVERDTLRRTLRFDAAADSRRIVADNVNGSITVTAHEGPAVELTAVRRVRAESRSRLERAKEEVTLDVREDGDRVIVYVDAPWRRQDGSVDYRGWDHYGYDVEYEIDLRVPARTAYSLRTVNGGEIDVRGMRGDFDVKNVNGGIRMTSVAGSGNASTVNGGIEVRFAENPAEGSTFRTVNGEVEVVFVAEPSADLRFSTMNGEVYTDFTVKSVRQPVSVKERRGGRKVYGGGNSFAVRAGSGGPEHSFSTINGDIYLKLEGDQR